MTSTTLRRSEISTHGEWVSTTLSGLSVDAYRELSGATARWPAGLAVVAARRAFTRDLPLPAGGVLLGIDVYYGEGWTFENDMRFRCATEERLDRQGRCILSVNVDLRPADTSNSPVTVKFALRWPGEADTDD